jgi:hypothetical protein
MNRKPGIPLAVLVWLAIGIAAWAHVLAVWWVLR